MKPAIPDLAFGSVFSIRTINLRNNFFNDLNLTLATTISPAEDEQSATQILISSSAIFSKAIWRDP